jgi:hypothetical protein
MSAPPVCPNCGAEVPPRAKACPECGSDEKTGWSDEASSSDLDLPDEEFSYDEFVKREFGAEAARPCHVPVWLWVIGILVLTAVVLILVL